MLREGKVKLVSTEIQEQTVDQRWIDSSEPLDVGEFMEHNNTFREEDLPIG